MILDCCCGVVAVVAVAVNAGSPAGHVKTCPETEIGQVVTAATAAATPTDLLAVKSFIVLYLSFVCYLY
jgi:hypothetical protein